MKMRAGGRLRTRKPATAPRKLAVMVAAGTLPSTRKTTSRKAPVMAAMPAARPSMLSRRLKALVMPTTQTSVRRMSTTGILVSRSTKSAWMRNPARTICATSLTGGRTGQMSSTSPMAPIARDASISVRSRPRGTPEKGTTAAVATMMARPPRSGTGRRCQRSSRGCFTSPDRPAAHSQPSVARSPTANESPNAAGVVLTTAPQSPWRAGGPRRGHPCRRPTGPPRRPVSRARGRLARAPGGARGSAGA